MSAPRYPLLSSTLLLALQLSVVVPPLAAANKPLPSVSSEEQGSIKSALSVKARAKPAKPRKVLIFHRTEGYVHSSIPVANEAVLRLGEVTGAYTGVVSDDMAMFDAATLNTFDGVIFVNTTGLKFENLAHRQALLDFVASGKGVMGLHAATDNFPKWPEGQALMGGVFHGHPWNSGDTVAVKLDEPEHVINTAFERRGFWIKEEIYQMGGPYGRDRQRVLMSLDMSRPENARPADKIERTDNDFAISWIKTTGKGRVFYSSLGHNKDVFYVPALLQHFLDGFQFALGDLAADAMPSASLSKLPTPALAPDEKITLQDLASRQRIATAPIDDDSYAQLGTLDGNKPPVALGKIENTLRVALPQRRLHEEPRLLALLDAPGTTVLGKQAVLRILAWAGSAAAVPALEKHAKDEKLAFAIANALATIDSPSAETALVHLASSGPTSSRVAAINALGRRPGTSAEAIAGLRQYALSTTPAIGAAALEALASLDTAASFKALRSLPRAGAAERERTQALLDAADRSLRKADTDPVTLKSVRLAAREVMANSKIAPQRNEAARILLATEGPKAIPVLLPLTRDTDALVRLAATSSLIRSGHPEALKALLGVFETLEIDARQAILHAAEEAAAPTMRPFALAGLNAKDKATRSLAILALGRTGDETAVDTLIPLLGNQSEDAKSAKLALGYLPTGKVDDALRAKLATATTPDVRSSLLNILVDRQDHQVLGQAVAFVQSDEKPLRAAAFDAVSKLVRPGELPLVLPLAAWVKTGGDRRDWQKAVFNTAAFHPSPNEAVQLLQTAISAAQPAERPILIGALTAIPGDQSAPALRAFLASKDAEARKEVIRALSAARTKGAFILLLETAKKTEEPNERILALRGYLDTMESQKLKDDQCVGAYRNAWPLATRSEEKDAIVAAIKRLNKNNNEVKKFLAEIAPEAELAPSQT